MGDVADYVAGLDEPQRAPRPVPDEAFDALVRERQAEIDASLRRSRRPLAPSPRPADLTRGVPAGPPARPASDAWPRTA